MLRTKYFYLFFLSIRVKNRERDNYNIYILYIKLYIVFLNTNSLLKLSLISSKIRPKYLILIII